MRSEDRHERIAELFAAALEMPEPERLAFLEKECGDDVSLFREVVELLEKDADPSGPLGRASDSGSHSDETPSSQLIQKLTSHKPKEPRYKLVGEIARGGMGAILKVWDDDLGRPLAMKVILGQAEAVSRGETPPVEARKLTRFLEEAQITGQLDHPGIVPVHELGIDDQGQVFFTMRLVKGDDLKHILDLLRGDAGGWNRTRALGVLLQVCEAMAFAHNHRVIHRDLKPANIMVGRFGEVYVMDWGLGRSLDKEDSKDIRLAGEPELPQSEVRTYRERTGESSDATLLTKDGDVVGTPAYMSPEQARGELDAIGKHSDVYSIGAILYEVLTGKRPYQTSAGASPHATWHWVLEGAPTPIEELAPDVAPELVAICEKAMARDVDARYPDMSEMASELRAFLEHRVVRAYQTGAIAELKKWVVRNRGVAASLAALLVVTVVSGFAIADAETRRAQEELRSALERSVPAYVARADELYPVHPSTAAAMGGWLAEARELVREKPRLETELQELRLRAVVQEPRPTPSRADREDKATQLEFLIGILSARAERAQAALEDGTSGNLSEDESAAEVLPEVLPALRQDLDALRGALRVDTVWRFDSSEDRERHERLGRVVEDLRRLDGADGLITVVAERLALAEELEKRTVDDESSAWDRAIRSIASEPLYGGLALEPQIGLVPLRQDPESRLWEFWHFLSGTRPEPLPEGGYRIRSETGIVLVLLPPGRFVMGAQSQDPNSVNFDPQAVKSEGPPLLDEDFENQDAIKDGVDLDAFFLARYEMTQGQFLRAAGFNPSERFAGVSAGTDPRFSWSSPVEHVSWNEGSRALLRWSLDFPTEAQWEYAARAGSSQPYGPSANFTDLHGKVNFNDASGRELSNVQDPDPTVLFDDGYATHAAVDAFPPNAFGLQQMLGNVAEWARDEHVRSYAQVRDAVSGTFELRPFFSNTRTVRGGHYESDPKDLRVSRRVKHMANYSNRNVGLRPCRRVE